jgi:endo-alpha-1,4-polygalactosaminidase (GH114 family)
LYQESIKGKIEDPTRSIEGDNMIAYCDVCDAFTYRFYLWEKLVRNEG